MGLSILEPPIVAKATGTAEQPAGAIDLTGYRHLTYAPSQWGPGIRTAAHGTALAAIVEAAAWVDLVPRIEGVARGLDLTWDELFDALRYARDHGPL